MPGNGVGRVVVDGSAILKNIRSRVQLAEQLGKMMEPVLAEAQRTAPDSDPAAPGYREGLKLDWGIDTSGRAYARVLGTAYNSGWVEFGAHAGGKTFVLRYRILGNALQRVRG
jgi:hypothetical protein